MKSYRLYIVGMIMGVLPASRCFSLKRSLLRWAGGAIGDGVRCISSATFLVTGKLTIGCEAWIGHEVLVVGGESSIHIGARCDIGPRVTIVSGSHEISVSGPRAAGAGYSSPISIGDGCWIGAGATILGGTVIGDRCVVAAGAIVKGVFPSECLIGGTPARIIRASLSNVGQK